LFRCGWRGLFLYDAVIAAGAGCADAISKAASVRMYVFIVFITFFRY
jgi:hypothetical protein